MLIFGLCTWREQFEEEMLNSCFHLDKLKKISNNSIIEQIRNPVQ